MEDRDSLANDRLALAAAGPERDRAALAVDVEIRRHVSSALVEFDAGNRVDVDDLIDALIRLMATPNDVTGPINLGNPNEFSMLELAQTVIGLTGARSRIVHRPRPEDDPRQRRPDISKAQDLLSWTPKTPLKEGLAHTIAYFDKLLSEQGIREMLMNSSLV